MNPVTDIKIIGIDEARPPRMRKEAYIDLYFKLSEKAPLEWCEIFNALGRQIDPSPKIDKDKGACIDTYVKSMDLIASHFADIKQTITDCNEQFQEKIRQQELALAASNAALQGQDGEQNKLNQIIEALDFNS